MSGTGKHQEVKSKQNLDGTFEFIVEDSDATDSSEEPVEATEAMESSPARPPRMLAMVGVAAAVLLGAVVLVYTMGSNETSGADAEEKTSGFRPYKASGSNVEVPADAPSNEIPVEETAEKEEPEEAIEVAEEAPDPEAEVVEEPLPEDEEFVEADEVIGDGEILDGSEEEMLEAAQQGRAEMFEPVLKPTKVDMERIQENVRSQIMDGVNPRQIQGIRNLSAEQIRQLQKSVELDRVPSQDISEDELE